MKLTFTYPILTHDYDPRILGTRGLAQVAVAAEAVGFDGIGFTDHPAPPQRWLDTGGHDALDPFVALGYAAAVTSRLRLVPNIVVLPYRNPFVVAKAGATLDVLSDGRFTLAAGAGYLKREFSALGVDYEARNALFDEALQVIRAIWTSDDVSFEGGNFQAKGITARPRPVAEPHPPIWIGGNAAAARQRVADHGDGWCPAFVPAQVAQYTATVPLDTIDKLQVGIDDVRERLAQCGRDPDALDIAFSNPAGGNPGDKGFDPATHLQGIEQLSAIGVTWAQVSMPGDSLSHLLEAIAAYGELVIRNLRPQAKPAT